MSTHWERAGFAALLCSIAVTPLALNLQFLHYDVTPKLVSILMAGAFACLCFTQGAIPAGPPYRRLLAIAGLHAAVLVLCTVVASSPGIAFGGGTWRRFGLAARLAALLASGALLAGIRARPNRWLWTVRALCAAGLAASAYGIAQYLGWDPFIDSRLYRVAYWNTLRPPSTLGHADYFAIFAVQVIFWSLSLVREPAPSDRALGYSAAVASSFALLLTGTRAGILGVAAGLLFLALAGRRELAWRRILVPVVVSLAAALALYLSPAGVFLRARAVELTQDAGGPRLLLWRDSLTMGFSHPAASSGLESFTQRFPAAQSTELSAAYPDHHHESPHNIFLDVLTEQGLPGLAVFVALLAECAYLCRAALKARRDAALVPTACVIASLVTHQFTALTLAGYLMLLTTLVLAVALAPPTMAAPETGRQTPLRLLWLAGIVLSAGLAAKVWQRETRLHAVDSVLKAGQLEQAIESYGLVDRRAWLGETPDLWFSRRLAASVPQGAPPSIERRARQIAIEVATRAALSSEERYNACFHLAYLWALSGNAAKAEESLRDAIRWAPGWYKPRWYLSKLLASTGRAAEAAEQASMARKLSGKAVLE